MGKTVGAIYDSTIQRWLCGNTTISVKGFNNIYENIFLAGYEDPTYLTFRVEFGGWGWSVLPFSALTGFSINDSGNSGETVLSALKITSLDYDLLPIGLMDMHFINYESYSGRVKDDEISSIAKANYAFNSLNYYNAYNYLLMRQEDTRAEYLKTFIMGIYELQKENPYIFLSITGLDGLLNFNTTDGMRLSKDTTISITCIEGLSLKVKTLMELYRKAAWDDMWQRWVLPENMREFKMIIYVFERRLFHLGIESTASSYSEEYEEVNKKGKKTTKTKTVNVLTDSLLAYATFNEDLPVYALECSPCEFIIDNSIWKSEYDTNWSSSDPEKTIIKIKVKNVLTYYKNGLMLTLNDILIYDLLDAADRQLSTDTDIDENNEVRRVSRGSNLTINSVKGNYMQKSVFLQNEINSSPRVLYGSGETLITQGVENLSYLLEILRISQYRGILDGDDSPAANLMGLRESANWWNQATVIGQDYWNNLLSSFSWKKLGQGLLNIITAGTLMIRVSNEYNMSSSAIYYNILNYIDYRGSWGEDTFTSAIDHATLPNAELLHEYNSVTNGLYSFATAEKYDTNGLDLINSKEMTGDDYSWATTEYDEYGHVIGNNWNKRDQYKTNKVTRIKQDFTWYAINSRIMTGDDYSWATTEYDENGHVKGNDWKNASLYNSDHVSRLKQDFNWQSIDSILLTNNDFSHATIDDKRNVNIDKFDTVEDTTRFDLRNDKSMEAGRIDSKKLSDNDYSWATKDDMNPFDHNNQEIALHIDNARKLEHNIIEGNLDRDVLTNYDYSWATKDENNVNDHKHPSKYLLADISTNRDSIISNNAIVEANTINSSLLTYYDYSWATPDPDNLMDHKHPPMNATVNNTRDISTYNLNTLDIPEADTSVLPSLLQLDEPREYNINITDTTDYVARDINDDTMYNLYRGGISEHNKEINLPLDKPRNISDLDVLSVIDDPRKIMDTTYTQIDKTAKNPIYTLTKMEHERFLPDIDVETPFDPPRQILENELVLVLNNTVNENPAQLTEIDKTSRRINKVDTPIIENKARHNITQIIPMDDTTHKNIYTPLSPDLSRQVPNYNVHTEIETMPNYKHYNFEYTDLPARKPITDSLTLPNNKQRSIYNKLLNITNDELRTINDFISEQMDAARTLPNNIVLNRIQILDIINDSSSSLNSTFMSVDQENKEVENITHEFLQSSDTLAKIDINENNKNDKYAEITAFAKTLASENSKLKKLYTERINKLKNLLKKITIDNIRELPSQEYAYVELSSNHKETDPILLSPSLIALLKTNVKLIGLDDSDIDKLSYKSLISLQSVLSRLIDATIELKSIELPKDRSAATDFDGGPHQDKPMEKILNSSATKKLKNKKSLGHVMDLSERHVTKIIK